MEREGERERGGGRESDLEESNEEKAWTCLLPLLHLSSFTCFAPPRPIAVEPILWRHRIPRSDGGEKVPGVEDHVVTKEGKGCWWWRRWRWRQKGAPGPGRSASSRITKSILAFPTSRSFGKRSHNFSLTKLAPLRVYVVHAIVSVPRISPSQDVKIRNILGLRCIHLKVDILIFN